MSKFVRHQDPPAFTHHDRYRPFLRVDFLERCAYCERTEGYLGGQDFFTVDHLRPRSRFPALSLHYPNLYYSCGKCNQHKADSWPQPIQEAKGFRFSDPCEEDMYRDHLQEQEDGTLKELDNCGRYTCQHICLNRPDLVKWRQLRREMARELGIFAEIRVKLRNRLAVTTSTMERDRISTEIAQLDRVTSRHRATIGLPSN